MGDFYTTRDATSPSKIGRAAEFGYIDWFSLIHQLELSLTWALPKQDGWCFELLGGRVGCIGINGGT